MTSMRWKESTKQVYLRVDPSPISDIKRGKRWAKVKLDVSEIPYGIIPVRRYT